MTPLRTNLDHTEPVHPMEVVRPLLLPLLHIVELSLFLILASSCLYAQAAAEYGGATSGIAGSVSQTNLMNKAAVPDIGATGGDKPSVIMSQPIQTEGVNPKYIFDSMKQGSVAENRKVLEEQAGKNAAKLMLRSTPTHADVRIDGKPVGKTPILLVLPPGQYDVVMNGPRMDHAEQNIDLLPNETREFLLPLKQLYPTTVKIELH